MSNTIEQELETVSQERDELLNEIENLKRNIPSRESSFSINFHLIDKFGAQMQLTLREGVNMEVIKGVLVARHQLMEMALENGYRIPGRAQDVAPAPAIQSLPTPPVAGAVPPPPPASAGGGQGGESLCSMIEVGTSYQGNKTQLKFHCNGMEHPLSYTKDVKDMAKLLEPLGFTAAHIVVGQKYPFSCMVKWVQGEKYKNVVSVRPA